MPSFLEQLDITTKKAKRSLCCSCAKCHAAMDSVAALIAKDEHPLERLLDWVPLVDPCIEDLEKLQRDVSIDIQQRRSRIALVDKTSLDHDYSGPNMPSSPPDVQENDAVMTLPYTPPPFPVTVPVLSGVKAEQDSSMDILPASAKPAVIVTTPASEHQFDDGQSFEMDTANSEVANDHLAGSNNGNVALHKEIKGEPQDEATVQVISAAANANGCRRSQRKSIQLYHFSRDFKSAFKEEEFDLYDREPKIARIDTGNVAHSQQIQEGAMLADVDKSKVVLVIQLFCNVDGCTDQFQKKDQLEAHQKARHDMEKHVCLVRGCKESFNTWAKFCVHRRAAHGKLTGWPCDKCTKQYKKYRGLVNHCSDLHDLGHFACGSAGCVFTAETRRKVMRHHATSHKPFRCIIPGCNQGFKSAYFLKKHKTLMHPEELMMPPDEKPVFCAPCSKLFIQKSSLDNHIKTEAHLRNFQNSA